MALGRRRFRRRFNRLKRRRIRRDPRIKRAKNLNMTIVKAKRRDVVAYVHRHMPFPTHYICKLNSIMEGNYIPAEFSADGNVSFRVSLNHIKFPWTSPLGISTEFPTHVAGAGYGASPYGGYTNATLEPQGLGQLLQRPAAGGQETRGIYESFRVISSKLTVQMTDVSVSSDCWVTICPYLLTGVTNQDPTLQSAAAADPFSRTVRISYATNSPKPQLTNSISVATLAGQTPQQVINDFGYTATWSTTVAYPMLWGIFLKCVTGVQPASPVFLKVECEWVTEFFGPVGAALDAA